MGDIRSKISIKRHHDCLRVLLIQGCYDTLYNRNRLDRWEEKLEDGEVWCCQGVEHAGKDVAWGDQSRPNLGAIIANLDISFASHICRRRNIGTECLVHIVGIHAKI